MREVSLYSQAARWPSARPCTFGTRGTNWSLHTCRLQEGRYKTTRKREFKLPWREAGSPNHPDDEVDSDQ